MALIFDLVLLAVIILFTFLGYKQGLVKAAIKILSFFIAIILSFILYKPVSNAIINNTTIDENIKGTIVENLSLKEQEGAENSNIIKDTLSNKLISGTNNTIDELANAFTIKLIDLLVLIILYIIIRIILKFISILADSIANLPILKQINKVGGIIYGFIKGVLIVYIALAVIYLIAPVMNNDISESIDHTLITKHVYNNNVLLKIIL